MTVHSSLISTRSTHNDYRDNMDLLMHRVEWTTLLFFASMFVTLECLERLGLVHWFSEHTINLIAASDNENIQLITAIFILIWVSLTVNKKK